MRKLGVELAAKFTWPAGASGVETTYEGMVYVFHEEKLLRGENGFARFVR